MSPLKFISSLSERLASLRLTVTLFALLIALLLWGTLAQTRMGIYEVQSVFFGSFFIWQNIPGTGVALPVFPGGFLLGTLLFINLAAAHSLRFTLAWRKSGIYLIHFGFFLLLSGGFLTGLLSRESQMRLTVGESSSWSDSFKEVELVLKKEGGKEEYLFPQKELEQKKTLTHPDLPFSIEVTEFHRNANLYKRPEGVQVSPEWRGDAKAIEFRPAPLESKPDRRDAATLVFLTKDSKGISSRWLASILLANPQKIETPQGNYLAFVRFKQFPYPFTLTLLDFTHQRYPGTETPKKFASHLLLKNPDTGEKREVNISMNEPLRYGGETFYQSGFANDDKVSILQVVRNPAWVVPYFSSILMALGLIVHFTILLCFGSKQRKTADKTVLTSPAGPHEKSYIALLPVLFAIAGLLLWASFKWPQPSGWNAYASLPLIADGRLQPFDTLARNNLLILSGRSSFQTPEGQNLDADAWLLGVMTQPEKADTWPVFYITHPEVLSLIGKGVESRGRFSFSSLTPRLEAIASEAKAADALESTQRTSYHRAVMRLFYSLNRYVGLKNAIRPESDMVTVFPQELQMFENIIEPSLRAALLWTQGKEYDKMGLSRFQAFLQRYDQWRASTFVLPIWPSTGPSNPETWKKGGDAIITSVSKKELPPGIHLYASLAAAAHDEKDSSYQEALEKITAELRQHAPEALDQSIRETRFNRLSPFLLAGILYVGSLFLFLISLRGNVDWRRSASRLLLLAWLVHTFGIIARMWIEGRPPVTNLYSSAIFIGWAAVLIGLLMEFRFRNGLALLSAILIGLATLLISHHLSREGDTMGVLIAVLDTNAWLATHVVAITLGYTATFFAGALGMIDAVGVLILKDWAKTRRPELYRMCFAIVCIGLLFSFVGTVLGGLWADQSWGRFWGWDPKENGALLIVLWLALMVHARLGGLVKEKGFLRLSLIGNMITAFSWFGTNMLGIGLHSYGFTNEGFLWLSAFWFLQLVLLGIGLFKFDPKPDQS